MLSADPWTLSSRMVEVVHRRDPRPTQRGPLRMRRRPWEVPVDPPWPSAGWGSGGGFRPPSSHLGDFLRKISQLVGTPDFEPTLDRADLAIAVPTGLRRLNAMQQLRRAKARLIG